MQKIKSFTLLVLFAASSLAQAQTTTPGYIINTPEQARETSTSRTLPTQPPSPGQNVPAYPYGGSYFNQPKKILSSPNVVVAREKPLNTNMGKLEAQKRVGEVLANLVALSKHCEVSALQRERINQMKLRFEGSAPLPVLTEYIKNSLETGFILSTEKRTQGASACEPNNYFIGNIAEVADDINRTLSFKTQCASVYSSPKISEFLEFVNPLDKFTDYAIVADETKEISKNLLAYCNAKTENDLYVKALKSFQDLNTKIFNNPGNN